ncbi:hypothetical protein KSC_105610 [Ktedonobacter sp. SOSP1-52]|uniref:hypothetical protein n=1 Tax=Ktedonobacter sp. SOSP1-52 TaxID=2778366 RepID=UPI001915759E|nr:hypothetical protein [Ktedonobacter sp. SOSP1-52]GHO71669.1 hypothetical protein KSC_105610 [Ktedonobacter sp. SOSP1-52]
MSNHSPQLDEITVQRYEQALEDLYTQSEIPSTLTWNDVQARRIQNTLQGKRNTGQATWPRSSSSRGKRIAVVIAAALLLTIISGTAYASGILDRVISSMIQPGYVQSGNPLKPEMYTTLNLTSQDGELTGKLETAYADPNELILGLSANHSKVPSAGKGGEWDLYAGKVTTSDGFLLPPMSDATTNGGGEDGMILEIGKTRTPVDPNTASIVATFDTSQIQGNPTSLHIHAEFIYYCIGMNGAQCAPEARAHDITHPYKLTYDVTVPFHAGKIVNVNKTVISDGKAVTLERVIIAPSGTRLFIHGLSFFKMPSRNDKSGSDETQLSTGDQTYHKLILVGVGQDITNPQDPHHLDTAIYVPKTSVGNDHNWTLHILNPKGGAGWTFTFTV